MESRLVYAVLCTDGQIDVRGVLKECRPQKWVPLFAYREEASPDIPIIPIFDDPKAVQNFTRRNLPADWLKGAVFVTPQNIEWMEQQGWKLERMQFPRLLKDLPVTFGFEIMQFFDQPEVVVR